MLGHDRRNPLAVIGAGAELLLRRPLDQKASRRVAVIQKSVARIGSLIEDLMDFARGRLGNRVPIERTKEPLTPILEQIVAEARASFPDRVIETEIAFDDPVGCDQSGIGQVLSNLLRNTLTYGAADTPICVRARLDGLVFELSVANAGDPISPATMDRLFQPITRGAVRPSQQGLGLGLFIASEVAHAHSRTLKVVSSSAETRFTFRMPLAKTAPTSVETKAVRDRSPPLFWTRYNQL